MIKTKNYNIFFINKFNWIDKNPMTTISTFSTYALSQYNNTTTLITAGDESADTEKILKDYYGIDSHTQYTIKIMKRSKAQYLNSSIFFYFRALKYILKNVDTNQTNVVISRNTTFLPFLFLIRLFTDYITIFETHGYHGKSNLDNIPVHKKPALFSSSGQYYIYERLLLNRIHGIVCITSPQLQLYKKDFLKKPAIFLPLGSSGKKGVIKKYRPDQTLFEKKHLVYTGRLTNHIDTETLCRALSEINNTKISFTWVGLKENDFKILDKYVKKYCLQDIVNLHGWISHSELATFLLDKASVGLALYKNTFRSAAVTSPSKIFDYFSFALPVIAPRMANIEDIIADRINGMFYNAGDPRSLAQVIEEVFDNKKLFTDLRQASINSAETFSWHNRAQKLLEFLQDLENK